jgi:HlyD family secretion protein
VLIGLLAAPPALQRLRGHPATAFAPSRSELVQTVVATGRVSTLARVEIGSLVSGTVAGVAVREGDRVAKGQVLLRLVDDEARAAVAQAKAAAAQARAAVAQAEAALAAAQARLDQVSRTDGPAAAQAVRIAEAELEAARRSHERVQALVEKGMVARADLDEARRALETAEGRFAREQTLAEATRPGGDGRRVAEAAVGQARAGVAQAEAGQAQARAALAEAEARLARTVIAAPADGAVVSRAVEEGDTVQPGRALLVVSRPGRTEIVASVDEKNLSLLTVGNRAHASADAYPGRSFPAVLATIVPAVVASSGTVTARFAVPEPPDYLLPEMTVSIEVEVARKAGALSLPAEAVRDLAGSPWVLAVRDGRAVRVPVRLGVRGAGIVEVLSGLGETELVLPEGAGKIAPGDKVRVTGRREG